MSLTLFPSPPAPLAKAPLISSSIVIPPAGNPLRCAALGRRLEEEDDEDRDDEEVAEAEAEAGGVEEEIVAFADDELFLDLEPAEPDPTPPAPPLALLPIKL